VDDLLSLQISEKSAQGRQLTAHSGRTVTAMQTDNEGADARPIHPIDSRILPEKCRKLLQITLIPADGMSGISFLHLEPADKQDY
jgi:hypothetical protein